MAATAQPRTGRRPSAQRGRHTAPKWAERFPDTPEGLDALQAHQEARRLPLDTNPDSIHDADVRSAFLEQLQDHAEAAGDDDSSAASSDRATGTPSRGRRIATQAKHHADSLGDVRARPVGAPTLRPPSSLSGSDGTGFMLGLVLYAIGINYLRHGPDGVKGWFMAKFLNRPTTSADLAQRRRDENNFGNLLRPKTGRGAPPPSIFPTPGPSSSRKTG